MSPTRYVWWDDKRNDPPTRMELRPPKSLHDFAKRIAETHEVSINAFIVALMHWAFVEEEGKRLRIEVQPSIVRVTATPPPRRPADFPSQIPSTDDRNRYRRRKRPR